MKELTSILKKKTWTGREVGLALLKTIDDQLSERKRNPKKRTFTPEDIQRMVQSLDNVQAAKYNEYCAIYSTVIDSFNLIQAMNQQFLNGFNQHIWYLREIVRAEDYYHTVARFPLVMTQKEYDERKAAKEKEHRDLEVSLSMIIFHAAEYYGSDNYGRGIKPPAPIKKAIDALKGEPIKRDFVLETYTKTKCRYIFDGKLISDENTDKEISEYLTAKMGGSMERTRAYLKVFFEGEEGVKKLYKRNTGHSLPKGKEEQAVLLFNLMVYAAAEGDVDLPYDINKAPLAAGLFVEPVKVKTEEIVEEYEGDKLDELSFISEDYEDHFSEFIEDYPALYKALREDLEKHLPKAKKIKDTEQAFTTWGELADAGYMNYADMIKIQPGQEYEIMEGNNKTGRDLLDWRRAFGAGIAIYMGDEYKDPTKRAKGLPGELFGGIEYYMRQPEAVEKMTQKTIDELILPAVRFIYAYNEVLRAILDVYEIPFLHGCEWDTSDIEERIENADDILYTLYNDVFGTEKERTAKRDFLRQYFKPLTSEELKPTKEACERIREKLRAAKGTSGARDLLKNYETLILDVMPGGGEQAWRNQIGV